MTDENIPNHVALIPDGNRRWAKSQGLVPTAGHEEGIKRFWELSEALFKKGVNYVTFWGASGDNLRKRTPFEVQFLAFIAKSKSSDSKLLEELIKNEIKVRVVGKWNEILNDTDLAKSITDLESKTAHFTKRTITVLFGYSGIEEMLDAIPKLNPTDQKLSYEDVKQSLSTGFLPEVDLVVRTGGEPHWSAGFMMWHTANSQFYFTETLWPAFNVDQLELALADFAKRERRMGK
ncbi:MAG: di-trans,poly-cis-decaprenylcistransferase [Candidatus Doudnabacteria bacterium]|nr:di-trans,poly-cis-decaprenylcistransferase [Candidatus Doudnabacteria bacterium]